MLLFVEELLDFLLNLTFFTEIRFPMLVRLVSFTSLGGEGMKGENVV